MDKTEHKSFQEPEETREFPRGRARILNVGGGQIGRLALQPGWRCPNDVKPIPGTASGEASHFPVPPHWTAGAPDGRRRRVHRRPGDITALPSGHDAWVVGDEPVVTIDWSGAGNYAR
jgi:hypothetical protein